MNAEMRKTNAIFVAGQLGGLICQLDADALEEFLNSPDRDKIEKFRYEKHCRAAINFKREIDKI